jgi:CBS domain-containing protein
LTAALLAQGDAELHDYSGSKGIQAGASFNERDPGCFRFGPRGDGVGNQSRRLRMAAKSVQETMTPNPTSVRPDLPVSEAARVMRSEDVGSLPVVEDDRLVGVVTDRDIAVRVVAEGKDPDAVSVGEIQSSDPVTVDPKQDLREALTQMARHQVRRVPVVDNGRIVGVLAQADVAREVGGPDTGELVEEISEP